MKEVYFKQIMIADLQNKTARVQPFEKGLNVVTSIDNHVGKSSLLKSLYYTLGAKVDFDSVWDRQSKLYVVTLSVDETEYCIARFMKRFAVFKGKTLLKITDSVTQELAPLLGDIFDFSVYLPNKDTGKVEMAPPAFTFMPYYIDQDKGWSGLYDSFSKELRKLPNKKEVEEKYIEYARLNIMTLDAWDPAYDGAIHLLKPIKAQGTLENKIILAQFVALFQTMEYFKTSATRFSFVVDSPRAKEASISSSKDILKMISQMEMLPQIILATIDYSEYDSEIETPANIIVLTEKRKLLNESDYVKNQDTIMAISELLKKQV